MARAYSLDLRERVVALVAKGHTTRVAAATFNVSVSSVVKWTQRARSTGSAAAEAMGGKRPLLLEPERDWLLARLDEKPDLMLHALRDELRQRGRVISCDTLWRFLKREEITFKKPCSPPSKTGQTYCVGAFGGENTKAGLIPPGLCSSCWKRVFDTTRPGPKPT